MKVTPDFIRQVQDAGWHIVAADTDSVWIGCPRGGCNLRTRIKAGSSIPRTCRSEAPVGMIEVDDYVNVARPALRERRQQLGLTIKDIEEVSGIADDHLAKMQKENPSKIPNILTFTDWARSLGFKLVLIPAELPQVTINKIVETRPAQERRRIVYRQFAKIRKGRGVAALPKP
jgi:transcriptional regulator with XRE-family HTH domain